MENKWYEFQIGLYVEAQTDEDAFRILSPVLDAANKVDPEGDAQVELVGTHPYGGVFVRPAPIESLLTDDDYAIMKEDD